VPLARDQDNYSQIIGFEGGRSGPGGFSVEGRSPDSYAHERPCRQLGRRPGL